ncbi:hypothetical protein KIN20_003284 [Parelaphostrongylus tenuis]|uniref:Uncharacterized protein n=1 Tax=Parelaphostrongylus tenuis TaxID=148309 RepID=A0AAD5MFE3_PARTN|nr:hypothetical protein KIN20_003284 [Parelaphostrongylus tenuis]
MSVTVGHCQAGGVRNVAIACPVKVASRVASNGGDAPATGSGGSQTTTTQECTADNRGSPSALRRLEQHEIAATSTSQSPNAEVQVLKAVLDVDHLTGW